MSPERTEPTDVSATCEAALKAAEQVLDELGLEPGTAGMRPTSGHNSSLLLPCKAATDGRPFLLKFFVPPTESCHYPAGVSIEDYARREAAFYRFLDSTDPDRITVPAPKTVLLDPADPPRWILLEWIEPAVGPADETLGSEHVFELLERLRSVQLSSLLGRRYFPLNHWEVTSYVDRARLMYETVLEVIGDTRWKQTKAFFDEALRWTDSRPAAFVHGDFTEQNIMVDGDGRAHLVDFERVGVGNVDHDFAWLWIHSERSLDFKRTLLDRYLGGRIGSERIQIEWGIRATLVYLALRRLRFGALVDGEQDLHAPSNIALLDAALRGGNDLFPIAN